MTSEEDYQKLEELRYHLQDALWVRMTGKETKARSFQSEISAIYDRIDAVLTGYDGLSLMTCKCREGNAFVRRTLSGSWYWICPDCKRYVIGKTHEEACSKALDWINGDGPASVLTEDPFIEPGSEGQ